MEKGKLTASYRIKVGLLSGLFFASAMAGFDYIDGKEFSILKFAINGFIFGTVMAFILRPRPTKN